ncbi:PilZ domain-containing protein [Cyanobium sp. ATX 6F1]|uniref:PilZ domain-containing protein n=1 Tax=unclassified Cyanobium TaxID=2627006 RepID=UPI0020CBC319|nr:PilZ domain-containing protein [Cyanobium sp. ATX 6F1]MCP9916263.1 PilZ domain-containing protein [Cyanobium sp. ATX 6F1]
MFNFLFGEAKKPPKTREIDPDDPRRNYKRTILHVNPPKGELRSGEEGRCHVTLWDVSRGGLCVVVGVKNTSHLNESDQFTLVLKESHGREEVLFEVTKMWEKEEYGNTYYGLTYSNMGLSEKARTFLEKYLSKP